jgi:hypothetical protein
MIRKWIEAIQNKKDGTDAQAKSFRKSKPMENTMLEKGNIHKEKSYATFFQ